MSNLFINFLRSLKPYTGKMATKAKMSVKVDEMLPYIGEFGMYQIIQMIMICLVHVAIILPAHHLSYFATLESPWRCIRNSSICLMNDTFTPEDSMYSRRCLLPRDSWTYTQNKAFSVITYFDLSCDWQGELVISAFYVGWSLGAAVSGWSSDRFGRRRIFFISTCCTLAVTLVSAFSPNVWFLIVGRLLVGFFFTGSCFQGFLLMTEMVGERHRMVVGSVYWLIGTLAYMLLPLLAYGVQDWKKLFIIASVPFSWVVIFFRFIP